MPFNLLKCYNELLDFGAFNACQRNKSLRSVFNRDIADNTNFNFKSKPIYPIKKDGETPMDILFFHLTTQVIDIATRRREFDNKRSIRLHWIKFHIEECNLNNIFHFSVKEREGIRTYIYDQNEKYVIILEPLRKKSAYFLITAYHLIGKDSQRDKIMKKYIRRESVLY